MELNTHILKSIFRAILGTRDDEIPCGECDRKIDEFVEMKLKGKSPEEAMPLVQDHLERCKECREEYEALLEALQNLEAQE